MFRANKSRSFFILSLLISISAGISALMLSPNSSAKKFQNENSLPETAQSANTLPQPNNIPELTEGNAAEWATFASDNAITSVSNSGARVKVGSQSIYFTTASGFDTGVKYPATANAHWDLTAKNYLVFWSYAFNNNLLQFQGNQPIIILNTPTGTVRYQPNSIQMSNLQWRLSEIPLAGSGQWVRTTTGTPNLADVNQIEIHQDTWDFGFTIIYDGMEFLGQLSERSLAQTGDSAGDLDFTFGTGGKVQTSGVGQTINSLALQTDGKIVGVGTVSNASTDFSVARYNPNGSLDSTFGTGGVIVTDFDSTADVGKSAAVQIDGKIIVAGSSGSSIALARYDSDGILDVTFGNSGKVITTIGSFAVANNLAIQSDGKIVVAGTGDSDFAVVRYNIDGSLDTSFGEDGIVTTNIGAFPENDFGYGLAIQPDGKIIACGTGETDLFAFARYNSDGSLDTSFSGDGKATVNVMGSANRNAAYSVAVQPDGKIVAVGKRDVSSQERGVLVRLTENGSLDTTFNLTGVIQLNGGNVGRGRDVTIQPDGKIVAVSAENIRKLITGNNCTRDQDFIVHRYNTDGTSDALFNSIGRANTSFSSGPNFGGVCSNPYEIGQIYDQPYSVKIQTDGKIIAAGTDGSQFALVRYKGESTRAFDLYVAANDISFNPASPVLENTSVEVSAIIHNGSNVINGTCNVRFYRNSVNTANLIGEQNGINVPANGQAIASVTWNTQDLNGDYTVIASIENVSPTEISTTNNTASSSVYRVLDIPDLQTSAIISPDAIVDQSFDISWTETNHGTNSAAPNWNDKVYLSADNQIGNDTLLATLSVTQSLAAGQSAQRTQIITIPRSVIPQNGNYYLIVAADADNNVNEDFLENNNSAFLQITVRRDPDLLISAATIPSQTATDSAFNISWTLGNQGTITQTNWTDKIFISSDAQLGNDTLLGEFPFAGTLDTNQTAERIQVVSIPRAAVPTNGTYYLIVVTDANNNINEGADENNNTSINPISVTRTPLPDLQVATVVAPNTSFFDQTIQIQWTVANNGKGATNSGEWNDRIYFSLDNTVSVDDIIGGTTSNLTYLNAGESYTNTMNVRIPRGIFNNYHILVHTDYTNGVVEDNNNNNVGERIINIQVPPLPDLQVQNVVAPEEVFAGGQISLNFRVENRGDRETSPANATNAWGDAIYLSLDQTLNEAADRKIGVCPHQGNVLPNEGYNGNCTLAMPGDIAGNWFVFVKTDEADVLYEFVNETNNSNFDREQPGSPMLVRATPPDLIVTAVNAPTNATAARQITVNWTVENQGAFDAAPAWFDTVYLSDDNVFNPQTDTPLGTISRQTLPAGQQYNAAADVRLPACISGTKYLFVMTDSRNQIFEYDSQINAEANNASAARQIEITNIPPDLQVTNITNPTNGIAGQPVSIGWTTANGGAGVTLETSWFDRLYLSRTATLDLNTALLAGTFGRDGGLNQGASYTRTENVVIPNSAQGNYYLFAIADAGDNVEECAGDGNNAAVSPTQINIGNSLPDLRIQSVNPINPTVGGSTFNVQWTGQNNGNAAANQTWSDTVYFSTNSTLDTGDRNIGSAIISPPVGSGANYQGQAQITLPVAAPGNYYLLFVADSSNSVFEGQNESNNVNAVPFQLLVPMIDLQISNVNAPTNAFSGITTNISWTITNADAEPTIGAAWTDYVFISRDQILDPTDRNLGFLPRDGILQGGASYNAALEIYVPQGYTGQWYLFVQTDRANQIAEANETNNLSTARTINLELPPPADLLVTSVIAPATATPGENALFQWTVQNAGANPALGLWTDSVYLSTDTVWDINDVLIGQETRVGPTDAGQNYNVNLNVRVPAVNLGQYHVIVRTDVRNRVRETVETNNANASSTMTTVDVTALQLGVPFNFMLAPSGTERYFKVNAPADETMSVTLEGQNGASNELFTRYGEMASRSQYDFLFERPGEPNQENLIPNTQAGTYFNLARADFVPQTLNAKTENTAPTIENATIKAEIIPFGIRSVAPTRIGDNGQVTITIKGAKFQNGATVKLVQGATELTAAKMIFVDAATVKARFQFTNAPHGLYDVVLTNPNNQSTTAAQSVTIESATRLLADINVDGNFRPRLGARADFSGQIRNIGNVDLPYTDVLTSLQNTNLTHPILITTNRPETTFPRKTDFPDVNWNTAPLTATSSENYTLDQFMVRDLPPSESIEFTVSLKGFELTSYPIKIIATPNSAEEYITRLQTNSENARQIAIDRNMMLPEPFASAISDPNSWWENVQLQLISLGYLDNVSSNFNLSNATNNLAGNSICEAKAIRNLLACTTVCNSILFTIDPTDIVPQKLVAKLALVAACKANCGIMYACEIAACEDEENPELECSTTFRRACRFHTFVDGDLCPVRPSDPNDKQGPNGFSEQKLIGVQQSLPYIINFENVATATAYAQKIRITDQLDPNLDWRTFRLKEIGFGKYRVPIPENRAFYQTRIQLGADLGNLLADVSAGIDVATGRVTWTLTAIDPATGEQPNSANLGLLPPNNVANDGQGFVTYTVKPKSNAATGAVINNSATIIFDTEQPIVTNTVSNTLDADIPTSAVNPLAPTQEQPTFTISWAGQDLTGSSGLQSYDIWVSENGAPYQPFLSGTTETSAEFTGIMGRNYRFYSIARDNAGNVETVPNAPDASTTLAPPTSATVSVGGRVTTADGRGISKAIVTLTGFDGESVSLKTNAFGYFRFDEVESGATYLLSVKHKRHNFAPRTITVLEDVWDLNVVAEKLSSLNFEKTDECFICNSKAWQAYLMTD